MVTDGPFPQSVSQCQASEVQVLAVTHLCLHLEFLEDNGHKGTWHRIQQALHIN